MIRLKPQYYPVVIILLCLMSRLPQLISPNLILDGDECVVAVMARNMLEGKGVSLFFLGQNFGFSLIEAIFILPFYAVMGVGTLTVKLPMLLLWTIGVVFLYRSLAQINNRNYLQAFLLTVVFIFAPAWAQWAMKARGGYLTAFTLSSITLYLTFLRNKSFLRYLVIGVLVNIIYQSQMLWLAAILPVVAWKLMEQRSLRAVAATIVPNIILGYGFHLYKKGLPVSYAPAIGIPSDVAEHITRIPVFLFTSLHGKYFLGFTQKPNIFQVVFCTIFVGLVFLLLLLAVYHLFFRRKGYGLFIFSAAAIASCLAYSILIPGMTFRYLLPVTGATIVAAQAYLAHGHKQQLVKALTTVLVACGACSMIAFWKFKFLEGTDKTLADTVSYLQKKGVHYVYCTDQMLTWQICYYSGGDIIARMYFSPGRSAKYELAVDSAYHSGARVATMGFHDDQRGMVLPAAKRIHEFFVCIDPPEAELRKAFQIHGREEFNIR